MHVGINEIQWNWSVRCLCFQIFTQFRKCHPVPKKGWEIVATLPLGPHLLGYRRWLLIPILPTVLQFQVDDHFFMFHAIKSHPSYSDSNSVFKVRCLRCVFTIFHQPLSLHGRTRISTQVSRVWVCHSVPQDTLWLELTKVRVKLANRCHS